MSRDIHQALKIELIGKTNAAGCEFQTVRMQWSKTETAVGLHVNPNTFSTFGLQRTDFLSLLGFERNRCAFFSGGECFARFVRDDLDLEGFGKQFGQAYEKLERAERELQSCGYQLPQPQGWGYFFGKSSQRNYGVSWQGDGHTAGKIEQMKTSEDAIFNFVFTWIEGGAGGKGWTIHYLPKHEPVSVEIAGIFRFLGIKSFGECPHCDFDPCFYRFIPFQSRDDDFLGSNANAAHGVFDRHASSLSPGIQNLLEAHRLMEISGIRLLPFPDPANRHREEIQTRVIKPPQETLDRKAKATAEFDFDAAISFAGTSRAQAAELATRIQNAGFSVFYDDLFPEDLWGKDLTVFFDEIFRKRSRFCVMFISKDYLERPWTIHERRSAMARAIEERGNEYILPIKVDDIELPGLQPTIGYLSIERGVERIAQALVKKLKGV
jgi:hypothetical protein